MIENLVAEPREEDLRQSEYLSNFKDFEGKGSALIPDARRFNASFCFSTSMIDVPIADIHCSQAEARRRGMPRGECLGLAGAERPQ